MSHQQAPIRTGDTLVSRTLGAALLALVALLPGCAGGPPDPNAVPAGDLTKLIAGHTVRIGNARAFYGENGSYTYNGANPGRYRVTDGQICVDFEYGRSRCDQIVRSGTGFSMITGTGDRVPFRPI